MDQKQWNRAREIVESLCNLSKRDTDYAYWAGYNCGLNGANETNCHSSIFQSPENTKTWEEGKRDAEINELTRRDFH